MRTQELKKLTPKERIFVLEYLIDLNPQRAAIAAGYSKTMAESKAYQWVSNSKVKKNVYEAIQGALKKREERIEKTGDEVVRLLWKMAELDLADYITVGKGGKIEAIPFDELPKGATKFISKIKQRKSSTRNKKGSKEYEQITLEYELPDKLRCLELLGKHYGIFKENFQHTCKDGKLIQVETYDDVKRLTTDELDAIIARGMELGYYEDILQKKKSKIETSEMPENKITK